LKLQLNFNQIKLRNCVIGFSLMGFILIIYIKFIGVEQYYQQYLSYMYVATVNFNGGIGAGSQSSRHVYICLMTIKLLLLYN
jgi:hypothetical protein